MDRGERFGECPLHGHVVVEIECQTSGHGRPGGGIRRRKRNDKRRGADRGRNWLQGIRSVEIETGTRESTELGDDSGAQRWSGVHRKYKLNC